MIVNSTPKGVDLKIIIYFRHITILIHQDIWKEFVQELPNGFNKIFKICVKTIGYKLARHYIAKESVAADDFEMMPNCTLSRDFGSLYSSMAFSDVELEVKGKTFRAHKVILSSN
jgi:hypothetical protein